MPLPSKVRLIDVGPRDGLQNENLFVPTATKIELVNRLQNAGLQSIEVTSFVSPMWVPQMADNTEVMKGIERRPGVTYSVLTPNLKGFEAAAQCKPDEVVIFAAASEAFSQKNINCSIAQSIDRFAPIVEGARSMGIRVRGAISTAVHCPYKGKVAPDLVARIAGLMKDLGVQQLSVADTTGAGTPRMVQRAMEAALQHFEVDQISGHFHDTYGQALVNVQACLQMGIWQFESSCSGLGGCPYAIGALGNLATEDIVYMLQGLDIDTGIHLEGLVEAGAFISDVLARPTRSRVSAAMQAKLCLTK